MRLWVDLRTSPKIHVRSEAWRHDRREDCGAGEMIDVMIGAP
jgi:hypothetical protein